MNGAPIVNYHIILLIVLVFVGLILAGFKFYKKKNNISLLEKESQIYKEALKALNEEKDSCLSVEKYKNIRAILKNKSDEELLHAEAILESYFEANKNDGIVISIFVVFIPMAMGIALRDGLAQSVSMLLLSAVLYGVSGGYLKQKKERYILSLIRGELAERKDHNNNTAICNSINKIINIKKDVVIEKKENDISPKVKSKRELYISIGLK